MNPKIASDNQKYILRKAFSDTMPEGMAWCRKTLPRFGHDKLFSRIIHSMANEYLSASVVKSRGLFEYGYVHKIVKKPKSGIYPTEQIYRIWSLIMSEAWARIFLDRRGILC